MEQIKSLEKKNKEENIKIAKIKIKKQSPTKFTQNFGQRTFFNATSQVLLNHLSDKNIDYSKEINKKMEKEFGNTLLKFKPKLKKSASTENFETHSFCLMLQVCPFQPIFFFGFLRLVWYKNLQASFFFEQYIVQNSDTQNFSAFLNLYQYKPMFFVLAKSLVYICFLVLYLFSY